MKQMIDQSIKGNVQADEEEGNYAGAVVANDDVPIVHVEESKC